MFQKLASAVARSAAVCAGEDTSPEAGAVGMYIQALPATLSPFSRAIGPAVGLPCGPS